MSGSGAERSVPTRVRRAQSSLAKRRKRPENRLAVSVAELLEDLAVGLDRRTIQCDLTGLFRIGVPTNTPPDPAMVFVALLVERGVLVLLEGHTVEEAATPVRGILAGRGGLRPKQRSLPNSSRRLLG